MGGRPRRLLLVAHRWVGLASSGVLAIVGLTGAVMVWPRADLLHRAAGRLHESLAIGPAGHRIVIVATFVAVLLEASGLVLWWRRKAILVRTGTGWKQVLLDLHHSVGVLCLLVMFTLAATAMAMSLRLPEGNLKLRRAIGRMHTTSGFPTAVKLLYFVGSIGFAVQGVTGFTIWWTRRDAT
jgi:uncharacterized iron-regulated membrane protein